MKQFFLKKIYYKKACKTRDRGHETGIKLIEKN